MNAGAGALGFLLWRSVRNRLLRQLRRLRTPRYAIAAVIGIVYIGFMVWSQTMAPVTRVGGPAPALGGFAGLGMALLVLYWWAFGKESSALAFQPAEVQFLFQAPLTRRQLLGYKIIKTQLLLLVSCLVWALLSRSWGVQVPGTLRVASLWGLFSVISLHHLGVALVQARPISGPRTFVNAGLRLAGLLGGLGLAAAIVPVLTRLGAVSMEEGFRRLGEALNGGVAGWLLAPFHLLCAPLYAPDVHQWAVRFAAVLGFIVAHLAWVLGMKVPFEESAARVTADVAALVAAFRARGGTAGAKLKAPSARGFHLPLRPAGHPAVAIAWKNTLAYWRTGSLRALVIIMIPLLVVSGLLRGAEGMEKGTAAAIPLATVTLISILMGPQMVRADLRQDLQQLGVIKTWPVAGGALVLAELAAPTAWLTLFQLVLLGASALVAPDLASRFLARDGSVFLVAMLPLVLLALNTVGFTIQNAIALMFPGWVRLGPEGGGIEVFGQRIVVTVGSVLLFLLALLVPVGAVAGIAAVAAGPLGPSAPIVGAVVGVLLLGFEVGFAVVMLGELFERTEPSALG